jgi:peroxiredoxin
LDKAVLFTNFTAAKLKKQMITLRKIAALAVILFTFQSGISQSAPEGLFIGSKAPDFKTKDHNGKEVRLKDLLKKGKVILIFYRGQWCPYCIKELAKLQDSLQAITAKGASIVAVTPEKPERIQLTLEKTKSTYPIIHDEELKIMKAYDVAFELTESTITRYRNSGLNVEENNGKNGNFLPVPAVFVIDKESTIVYRFFEPDYKKQAPVKEIMAAL